MHGAQCFRAVIDWIRNDIMEPRAGSRRLFVRVAAMQNHKSAPRVPKIRGALQCFPSQKVSFSPGRRFFLPTLIKINCQSWALEVLIEDSLWENEDKFANIITAQPSSIICFLSDTDTDTDTDTDLALYQRKRNLSAASLCLMFGNNVTTELSYTHSHTLTLPHINTHTHTVRKASHVDTNTHKAIVS